jgi:hypothetical protein
MRKAKPKEPKRIRLRTQRQVLRDVMLSAGECGTWLTLHELAQLTCYGETSISAQLRHLRKPKYGAHVVAKRQRHVDETLRGEEHGPVWEYQLQRGLPNVARRKPPRGGPERLEMSLVC